MQAILAYEFDVTRLVRGLVLLLRLVAARHDPADVVRLGVSCVAGRLLVACDAPPDREVPLHVDLAGALGAGRGRRGRLLVPAQLAPAVQSRRMLHDPAATVAT